LNATFGQLIRLSALALRNRLLNVLFCCEQCEYYNNHSCGVYFKWAYSIIHKYGIVNFTYINKRDSGKHAVYNLNQPSILSASFIRRHLWENWLYHSIQSSCFINYRVRLYMHETKCIIATFWRHVKTVTFRRHIKSDLWQR
jgi:hypothetical protein